MKTIQIKAGSYYTIVVEAGKNITVIREGEEPNTFKVGDKAEYDSYNFSYYGPILSITDKTVTIYDNISNKKRRLGFDTFAWRNWNFNLDKAVADNIETSYYI